MDYSSLIIIDVSRVLPSNSDSSESLTLPLTFFDLLWLKFNPVERVIFYRHTEATRTFFDSVIVPNLKSSLSLSLSHYLPLAGKLIWDPLEPKPSIVYSPNDAVSFTTAESTAVFSRLTGNEPFPTAELHTLVPELRVTDDEASIVSFQVTFFPNQGFCIGITAHHAVLDGKTATTFLKSWAYTCKQQLQQEQTLNPSLPKDLLPSYDRTVIKPPTTTHETEVINNWNFFAKMLAGDKEPYNPKSLQLLPLHEIEPDVFRYTLELTRDDIETLRERLERRSSSKLRLSTFVVTYSYAITCLIKARGEDPNRPVAMGFAVDYRSLMNLPIPSSYFGNCVSGTFNMSLTVETFMGEEGFLTAARLVSDSVEELDESGAWKIANSFPQGALILSVAGSTRFGVYGLDFGWGRPERVLVVSIDQGGAVSMAESRDGSGGVEVGFSLKKHEMDVLIDLLRAGLKE